jgi:hypothetical protein
MYQAGTVARLKGAALGILLRGSLMILMSFAARGASSLSLAWDGSTNANVAGYNVYYGNASHSYGNEVPAGTNLTAVVSGLTSGQYYFAVTAVDSLGNESDFSNEISYQIAGANQPPTISAIADQSTYSGQATAPISVTVNDPDTGAAGLSLSGVSSDTTLVPNGNIVFGGLGKNRTMTVTPATGLTGSAQITVTVSDGSLTAQSSFTLNVLPVGVNRPPTISGIADQDAYVGQSTSAISFTINDPDSGPNGLILSAVSSDTTIVPNANIVFGGSGQNRTLTVTPAAAQTGSTEITITVSDGSLTAQSSFAVNVQQATALPTASAGKSTYNGLFYESDAVRPQSAGAFKVSVTTGGKYSGTLQMARGRYSFSGQFGALCQGTNVVVRKGTNSLTVHFSLKPGTSGQLVGNCSDGSWTAQIYGGMSAFNSKTNPAPYMGKYTLEIPGQQNAPSFSLGNGFGTVQVDGNGNVKLGGTLGDGTKLSQSAPVGADGTWPLFAPLYSGKGLVIGWISFANRPDDDLHGTVNWIKLPAPTAHVYPGGLSEQSDAVGSVFIPGPQPFLFGKAQLRLGDAGNGLIMALKVSPTTGVFNGSILNRTTGKPVPFQGALLEKLNTGYGFVVVTNQSTPVTLIQ